MSEDLFSRSFVVPFADTDASGRTHNTAVLRWVEAAEHEVLAELVPAHVTDFPRVRIEVDYRLPTRFGDRLDAVLAEAVAGRTSIRWVWEIRRDGALCAQAVVVSVFVDHEDRPAQLPPAIRSWASLRD